MNFSNSDHDSTSRRWAAGLAAAGAAGLAAGAGFLYWGNRELHNFELKQLTIPLLPAGSLRGRGEFRLLHISDLHMIPGQEDKIAWVSALDSLQPDLVVNTGDNLSDARAVPDTIAALDPLLNRPGLFVFGTNDYWAPRMVNPLTYLTKKKRTPSYVELPWKDMRAVFIERGWHDATHTRPEFKAGPLRLAVAGVDDPHHDLDDYETIAGPPNEDSDLALALLHAPYPRVLRRFADDGYDLALAGHTHGGQFCLPGSKALVTNSGIDRARAQGLHDFDGMALHISNGLGTSKYAPFRFFCRPSATLLRLTERK
ncbi:metallophosphoesterase [Corynebacterium yudongzhengii]|uniref:Metallophosphoesterase n=1 Tax=Corynebacterium yudongzhengii TaxID=2080740 RepID=A0A2U1T5G5_9CORY|nr:metallophosphoesterase [Corynebacterium yudongzhengii]AWB81075.1 metallophosphoesterase [Corynebacterium yudongzhengii]PWC01232.1 metallophosphoesterase [Corynebacterium yudongzhengii]